METILVTGGLGFIGTNFLRTHVEKSDYRFIVADSETYAAQQYFKRHKYPNITIESVDICEQSDVQRLLAKYKPDAIFHMAAETHVCRSISGPRNFVRTNILGTWNLLEEWRLLYRSRPDKKFIHISTDEVFGELPLNSPMRFDESCPLAPRSPYAASKASSDLLALSYFETYDLPVIVTNCSNNFGPHQHEEKLIPATIRSIVRGEPVRVFGDGQQVRDWIYAPDHCQTLWDVWLSGDIGERYCIGGDTEKRNIDVIEEIWRLLSSRGLAKARRLDLHYDPHARPTDDKRYAINSWKVRQISTPVKNNFSKNLETTVRWYALRAEFTDH